MHKDFYASGFLFHLPTQQILLQKLPQSEQTPSTLWTLFSGVKNKNETPVETFQRVLSEELALTIPKTEICSVYEYFHDEKGKTHFIHYANSNDLLENVTTKSGANVGWFTFKQITKIPMASLTKQDITVGQRVINLAIRNEEALTNPPEAVNQ